MPLEMYSVQLIRICSITYKYIGYTYITSAWGCVVCFNYLGNAKAFTAWNGNRFGSTYFRFM